MVGGGHQHDGKEICSPSSYQICNFPCHTSTLLHPSLVNTLQKKDEAVTLKEKALKCGWEGRKVENDGSHSPVSQLVSNDFFFRSLRRHPNGQSIFYCLLWNFHDFGLDLYREITSSLTLKMGLMLGVLCFQSHLSNVNSHIRIFLKFFRTFLGIFLPEPCWENRQEAVPAHLFCMRSGGEAVMLLQEWGGECCAASWRDPWESEPHVHHRVGK